MTCRATPPVLTALAPVQSANVETPRFASLLRQKPFGLVRTLETFLRNSGSWTRCAEELHLHVNSVRYRVQRIQDLTGRDLSRMEDRVDFFLALLV